MPVDKKAVSGRREQKRELTRRQILDAAEKLLRKRNFEDISVDEIAEAADFAKGTFYYHFDSKESVINALLAEWLQDLVPRALTKLKEGTESPEILRFLMLEDVHWQQKNQQLNRAILSRLGSMPLPEPPEFDKERSWPRMLSAVIVAGQKQGAFRKDVEPRDFVSLFMLTHLHCKRELLHSPKLEVEQHVEKWLSIMFGGMQG